jgi:hypothetical protein
MLNIRSHVEHYVIPVPWKFIACAYFVSHIELCSSCKIKLLDNILKMILKCKL